MKIAFAFSGLIRYLDNTKDYWLNLKNKYNADIYDFNKLIGKDDNVFSLSPYKIDKLNFSCYKQNQNL